MESEGIISKIDEPTAWCSGMVVIPKANGKIRICLDLTHLNKSVQREIYPLPRVDETLAQLKGAKNNFPFHCRISHYIFFWTKSTIKRILFKTYTFPIQS